MLLERGPIDPIDVAVWTQRGPSPTFERDAIALASQLAGARAAIGTQLTTMGSDTSVFAIAAAGPDLDESLSELARQTGALDPSIGDVAAAAGIQEGEIAGLSSEAGQAIIDAELPPWPDYVVHPPDPSWLGEGDPPQVPEPPPPPGGTVADLINAWYHTYLRRDAELEAINSWSRLWPNRDAIEHGILYSAEYAGKVNGLYQAVLERDVNADELEEHRRHKDSLDAVEANVRARA